VEMRGIGIRDGRRPVRYGSRHINNGSQLLTGAGTVTPAWPSQCLCTGGTAAHCPGSRPGGLGIRSPHRYLRIPGRQWCRCPAPHSPAPRRRRTFPSWPMLVRFAPPRNHYTSGKVYELEYPRPSTPPSSCKCFAEAIEPDRAQRHCTPNPLLEQESLRSLRRFESRAGRHGDWGNSHNCLTW
jgi:hypothetical protein